MPIIPLFPTIIHGIEVEEFEESRQDLLDFVYDEQKKDPDGINLSNQGGGWHSHNEYHFHENYHLHVECLVKLFFHLDDFQEI